MDKQKEKDSEKTLKLLAKLFDKTENEEDKRHIAHLYERIEISIYKD